MEDLNNSTTQTVEPQTTSSNSDNELENNNPYNTSGIFDDENTSNTDNSSNGSVSSSAENSTGSNTSNSTTFYTREELIELGKPENLDKIDINRVPEELRFALKLFQSPYTKKFQKLSDEKKAFQNEREEFENEKKSFQDELSKYREEVENNSKQDILDTGRLSYKDTKELEQFSYIKAMELLNVDELNPEDDEHIELYNKIYNSNHNNLVNHRVSESIENRLVSRYGEKFVEVERAAQKEFKQLPYEDSITLLRARASGRIDLIFSFYDNVYNKLTSSKTENNNMAKNNGSLDISKIKNTNMPIDTISGTTKNTNIVNKYDTTGII